MTLGEKIKEARKKAGLSQEQLASKLNISRSAVAKWETDKGIPDIENLKAISQLLNVSIDYLLDNEQELTSVCLRESISLKNYGKGITKKKKDRVVREKYPTADIYTLMGAEILTKTERMFDICVGFFTRAFGTIDLAYALKNVDNEYYLVQDGAKQFLVLVTKEFIESREIVDNVYGNQFEIGNMRFTMGGKIKI